MVFCAATTLGAAPAGATTDYANARYRVLSAPDCVDASNMIAEFATSPVNQTYMRVQHIGDPNTPELLGEVANPVTWNVGQFSGFTVPANALAQAQRAFRDIGPPNAASAFQLWCNSAGFYINTRQFSHTIPLTLEGPSVSIARDLSPGAAVFRNGTSALTMEATIDLPVVQFEGAPFIDGTVQLSFVYYTKDSTSGTVFAHVIVLFDNRPAGVNGAGTEAVSADAYTAFVVSPLSPTLPDGSVTQYVTVSPYSDVAHFVAPRAGPGFFRAHVTYQQFKSMLERVKAESLPQISARPEDYEVTLFGVLGEVFPGTGTSHEVALGASVTDLTLSEAYYDVDAIPVVEFYNQTLDHYFISGRDADIQALDSGQLRGWARTGYTFAAYPSWVSGTSAVCRYYIPPASGDSHFFSASEQECGEVAAKFPTFILEDPAVMFMTLPDQQSGSCPSDTVPVYRLWNNRVDSNHRYTTQPSVKAEMAARGYVAEGYGPDAVALCTTR